MATKIWRSFTDEFKQEAVSLLASSGRPLTQVARELGIQPSMLRRHMALKTGKAKGTVTRPAGSAPSGGKTSAEHAEIRRLEKELGTGSDRTGHFEKGHRHLLGSTEMRFCFIRDQRATFPVRVMCKMLDVSASGYYAWRGRPESMRTAANRQSIEEIRRVYGDSRGRYGSPSSACCAPRWRDDRSSNRVARLMHHHGICARQKRRWCPRTTDSSHDFLLASISSADGSRHRLRIVSGWRTSRIFRPPRVGFIRFAVVLDMFSLSSRGLGDG